jgi:hypothetical protein
MIGLTIDAGGRKLKSSADAAAPSSIHAHHAARCSPASAGCNSLLAVGYIAPRRGCLVSVSDSLGQRCQVPVSLARQFTVARRLHRVVGELRLARIS